MLDGFIPDLSGAIALAPPALVQKLADATLTAAQKEALYLEAIYVNENNTIPLQLRLALYGISLTKHRWLEPGTSYCTW